MDYWTPLAMYQDGHFTRREAAWHTLMRWGALQEGSSRWEEAYAVARETMARVRRNVEYIVDFLTEQGYVFGPAEVDASGRRAPWCPPTTATMAQLERLTALVGSLPLSLRAWYEIVGSVSLQGKFSDLWDRKHTLPETDPLMVLGLDEVIEWVEYQREPRAQVECEPDGHRNTGERLPIAPDIYHKANISGGAPYEIQVPDRRVDAPLLNVWIFISAPPGSRVPYEQVEVSETFVSYLRRSFQWGGFPGHAFRAYPELDRIKPLIADMLPI